MARGSGRPNVKLRSVYNLGLAAVASVPEIARSLDNGKANR